MKEVFMRRRRFLALGLSATLLLAAGACGSNKGADKAEAARDDATPTTSGEKVTLRLGYFPNVTHASAIVGVEKGLFATALGPNVKLEPLTFNAGPAAVEALFAGGLDATYIGPNPAINAYVKSHGEAVRIISGATSGGAALVVKPAITKVSDLKGKKIASPQLGNTQDVALRSFLESKGLKTDPQGGGDVSVVPQENAQTLETFKAGTIDGAWVPEPWVSRLVIDGGGKVLVDEKALWPGGKFVTTHLIVRTAFLKEHADAVARLVQGQVDANDYLAKNKLESQRAVNAGIERLTGKKLADAVITSAWDNLLFTNDPISASLATSAKNAQKVGLLAAVDLNGIYDLAPLNKVLKKAGLPAISKPVLR